MAFKVCLCFDVYIYTCVCVCFQHVYIYMYICENIRVAPLFGQPVEKRTRNHIEAADRYGSKPGRWM